MTAIESPGSAFGANAWLVEEMYEQYRSDPGSVSENWRDFFEDYRSSRPQPVTAAAPAAPPPPAPPTPWPPPAPAATPPPAPPPPPAVAAAPAPPAAPLPAAAPTAAPA